MATVACSDESQLGAPEELEGRWQLSREEYIRRTQQEEVIEQLISIGYLSGSAPGRATVGVTVHERHRVAAGLNLYTSGHAPTAILMDMDGRELHRWEMDFRDAFPDVEIRHNHGRADSWRRARLRRNGDLLAIYEGLALICLDSASKLKWAVANNAHHDVRELPGGELLVLTREAHVNAKIDASRPILEDYLVTLGENGEELSRLSLVDAFLQSEYRDLFNARKTQVGDIMHTNTISILDGSHPELPWNRPGGVLTSMRNMDCVAVVDLASGLVAEAWLGDWEAQHEPRLLDNGNILLFDNLGADGVSRVIEIDPLDETLEWEYRSGNLEMLWSPTCGTASRLSNGNTLIVESDNGRALEVTQAGEIVWEFHNPARAGENQEYVATLYDLIRLPDDTGRGALWD